MTASDELLKKREARDRGEDPYAPASEDSPIDRLLGEIKDKAASVAASHTSYRRAIMEERTKAAKILDRALHYAKPAIFLLSNKIETRRVDGGVKGEANRGTTEHYSVRGVLVVDRFKAIHDDHQSGGIMSGRWGGIGLYALEDGRLALASRSGTWSHRQVNRTADGTPIVRDSVLDRTTTVEPVTAEAAMEKFRIEEALEGMAAALKGQEGLEAKTESIRARAAVLTEGLAKLVKATRP